MGGELLRSAGRAGLVGDGSTRGLTGEYRPL